jgi:hypothetical protein
MQMDTTFSINFKIQVGKTKPYFNINPEVVLVQRYLANASALAGKDRAPSPVRVRVT